MSWQEEVEEYIAVLVVRKQRDIGHAPVTQHLPARFALLKAPAFLSAGAPVFHTWTFKLCYRFKEQGFT